MCASNNHKHSPKIPEWFRYIVYAGFALIAIESLYFVVIR